MSLSGSDLGVLGKLAEALGLFSAGQPNGDWFAQPEVYLKQVLANPAQREALKAFIDEALGGEDRRTVGNTTWLPLVSLSDPPLSLSLTIDESHDDGLHIGLALEVHTTAPVSTSSLAIPLFRTAKSVGQTVTQPLLLGTAQGRLRLATAITLTSTAAVPGQARLGGIGLEVDLPTAMPATTGPAFAISLTGLQLPGATAPRDVRVAADSPQALDDALLNLVLALVKAQADGAAANSPIGALGGLLGLRAGDHVPDFPITLLPTQGLAALSQWVRGIVADTDARNDWLGYLGGLLGGARVGNVAAFAVGAATLELGLNVSNGPSGHTLLAPQLSLRFGSERTHLRALAELCRIDLVTGQATALPSLGLWAATGQGLPGQRVLDVTAPTVAQADTLRLGFALDTARKLTFVLAADNVLLGTHRYDTLDLTSPDAVMDALGNTVGDLATLLLAAAGPALATLRKLIGLDGLGGVPAVTVPALMSNPALAVAGYWRQVIQTPAAATALLEVLRSALADAGVVGGVSGTGTAATPWRLPLVGPLALEAVADGAVLTVSAVASTAVANLGSGRGVASARVAATLARLDLATQNAQLLPAVSARLAVVPAAGRSAIGIALDEQLELRADQVGLSLSWGPSAGLAAGLHAPNAQLITNGQSTPLALPQVAANGSVVLPPQAWDGLQLLVARLAHSAFGANAFLHELVSVLGWGETRRRNAGGAEGPRAVLRLADLVTQPEAALRAWLPRLLLGEAGPRALALVADLLAGQGDSRALFLGRGHPRDPYRLVLGAALPTLALWFPPQGARSLLLAAPSALRDWRPGQLGLEAELLEAALWAEAEVAEDIDDLLLGRVAADGAPGRLEGALAALAERWTGGDGRIVAPVAAPQGIHVLSTGLAATQLWPRLDIEGLIGRVPAVRVHVALGANAWPDAPAGRLLDLSTASLEAGMFVLPAAGLGDWYVALGTRAACKASASTGDGTPEQANRLGRWLDALASVSNDIAVVAVAGAGHAARIAAQAQGAVKELLLLGTPLSPIALTALNAQPTADALRLLHRLLPTPVPTPAASDELEDEDLQLGRALVGTMMELADLADPGADLRLPLLAAPAPRAGLRVTALFGSVSDVQVAQAITAITAAGLAERARARVAAADASAGVEGGAVHLPTGLHTGLRWALPVRSDGALAIEGDAALSLLAFDLTPTGIAQPQRLLRVRLRISDRSGWLSAAPDLGLRGASVLLEVPLGGAATESGRCRITLHDARVFGQHWERLQMGDGTGPVLPEARVLLSALVQRLSADVAGAASVALADVMEALGLVAGVGGVAADAVDQLIHDPLGLLRQRLARPGTELADALHALLGPVGAGINFATSGLRVQAGGDAQGRFGWALDASLGAAGAGNPGGLGAITGTLRLGTAAALPVVGGLQLLINLNPMQATLTWQHPGGGHDSAPLWPTPDAPALARMLAHAAPALGAQAALELLRQADAGARPFIDALLGAMGLLGNANSQGWRAVRPLAGLLRDPVGTLRSAGSLGADAVRLQALFDALRPLLGASGGVGAALTLAPGVALSVAADGAGARLALDVQPAGWVPAAGAAALVAGLGASLKISPSGPPVAALALHLGLAGAAAGRRAVHTRIGATGLELFLRPDSGPDIALMPFAGLGSLAGVAGAAAQAALPFVLDRLAEQAAPVGPLVATLGDALALRSGLAPRRFDAVALRSWASNPTSALQNALPSIVATGLNSLVPLLQGYVPPLVAVALDGAALKLTVGRFSAAWAPNDGRVTLRASALPVPGIHTLTATVSVNAAGLQELSFTLGPAAIAAAGITLRPYVTIAAGLAPAGGRRVLVGMSADGPVSSRRFALRWLLDPVRVALVSSTGALDAPTDDDAPLLAALRVVEVVADIAASVALAQPPVQALLGLAVGGAAKNVRFLMQGVLLDDVDPNHLATGLFDPALVLPRAQRLFKNIAQANIGFAPPGTGLRLSFADIGGSIGLQVGLTQRTQLFGNDVVLWLENDGSWISSGATSGGLFVGFVSSVGPLAFQPSLAVNGLGLRLGRSNGPLINAGLSIESVALHVCAAINASGFTDGGIQLQFSNLAVSPAGAGGQNGIAQGVLRDTGPTPPRPAFSPALALQKHGSGGLEFSLRAGDPPGPWWIAVQRGFGPLYLEQVGFDARVPGGRLERVSVLMDGSVSMFGLTCAVDDLQITYLAGNVSQPADFFKPSSWAVDLAGLAVSANMGGVSIAGGLLKQVSHAGQSNESIEYLGMLLGRFAVYGLTLYGGYGEGRDAQNNKFTAFFAIGAVNGPLGGPPAFFLTGIGGGLGINRQMRLPSDLSNFGNYPLIQALDIAAKPSDPETQLRELGSYFPMSKGTFWFAAGLSFTSFALVDGIAVVGVQIGDGLDINLLGLGRMALPRPQVALVSVEVALLARFSSSEGVLWVQGQLTDNSWLLYKDIKLTGGFAYVIWFKGERAGEFVFTLGGYHPSFSRPGYPQVPRLGLRWSIGSNIVIKSGSYFALTSEALMAGGDFEGSASWGPAWAEVKFGAHGIVYFDPFHYLVSAYASIAAGVTIDTWIFGEVTISVHIGARIEVEGPDFHGRATFEVGPVELTFEFGGPDRAQRERLLPDDFILKYLEKSATGAGAQAHALLTADGALPAKGEKSTPDGSSTRPFVVVVEFSMTFTSTVPATSVLRTNAGAAALSTHAPSRTLAVAPMLEGRIDPQIVLTWSRGAVTQPFPFVVTPRPFGRFPLGIWGPAGDPNNRKVPTGDMVEALNELDLLCRATPTAGGPEIPYHQVEIGQRLPLPFSRSPNDISRLRTSARAVAALAVQVATVDTAYATASRFLQGSLSPTGLAALRGERQAPPRPGTLAEGLQARTRTEVPLAAEPPLAKVYDHFIDPPQVVGLFGGTGNDLRVAAPAGRAALTTVKGSAKAWRVAPPTLAQVTAERSRSIAARLVVLDTPALARGRRATLVAQAELPPTAAAQAPSAWVARVGAAQAPALALFTAALTRGATKAAGAAGASRTSGATLQAGQTVVLKLPNAHADAAIGSARPELAVQGAAARVVLLGAGGQRLVDRVLTPTSPRGAATLELPAGSERVAVIALGAAAAAAPGLDGWHAGLQMPYIGWSSAVGPGCLVQTTRAGINAHRERADAGWVGGAEMAAGLATVSTTFTQALNCVLIVLDDPAAGGQPVDGRQLLMGLDGATRALDELGFERAPVLLSMDNRSVLAYDIVPDDATPQPPTPVSVTIASEAGWSLVAVMGSAVLDATACIALVAAHGLDAALKPLAPTGNGGAPATRLLWRGPQRSPAQRAQAQAHAHGLAAAAAPRALAHPPSPRRKAR